MKQAGMQVLCVVADPAQAVKAEKAGADAVIAEGSESGGHIGEVHTMPLVPAVVYSVSIPVVAAGGIGDGRGMAAAFMLGAEAVQCGSAFLVTEECPIAAIYKQKVLDASVTDTIVTGRMLKDVVRSLRSPLSELTDELEKAGGERAYIRELGHGALRRAVEGDWEHGSFQVGQTAGLLRKQVTCRELVVHMMQEAQSAIQLQAELWTK
jgi:enoyl-[acyl-carrier protein] reductase II